MDPPGGPGLPIIRGDGALERFFASAIATILTIIFSWRLLLQDEPTSSAGSLHHRGVADRRSIAMEDSDIAAEQSSPVSMATQGSDADDEGDDDTASVTSGPMLPPGVPCFTSRHGVLSSPDTASYYTISSPDSDAFEDARDAISPVPLHDVRRYYARSVRSPILSSPDTEYYSCQSNDELLSDEGMRMPSPRDAAEALSTVHYDPIHGMLDTTFDRATLRDIQNSDDDSDATLENNEPEDSSEDGSFSGGMEEYFVEETQANDNDSSSESEYGVIFESQLDRITEEESDQFSSSGRSNADVDSAPEELYELPMGQSPPRTSMINTARPLIIGPYTDRNSQFSRDNVIHQDGSPGTSPNRVYGVFREEGSGDDTPVVEQLPDWMRAYNRKSDDKDDLSNSPGVVTVHDTQHHVGDNNTNDLNSSADHSNIVDNVINIEMLVRNNSSGTSVSPGQDSNNSANDNSRVNSNTCQTPEEDKPMVGTVSKIRQQFESGANATNTSSVAKDVQGLNGQEGNYTFTIFKQIPAPANKQDKATQKTFKRGQSPGSPERISQDHITDHIVNANNEGDQLTLTEMNAIDNTNKTTDDSGHSALNDKQNNAMDISTSGSARPLTSKLTLDLSPGHMTSTGSSKEDTLGGPEAGNGDTKSDTLSNQTRGRPATKSVPPWRSIRASTSPAYQDSRLSSPSDAKSLNSFSFVETTGVETEYSVRTKSRYKYDGETPLAKSKSESNLNFNWSLPPSDDGASNWNTTTYSWGPEGALGQGGNSSGSLGNLSYSSGALSDSRSRSMTFSSYRNSYTPTGGSPEHFTTSSRSTVITRTSPVTISSGSPYRRSIHAQRAAVRRKPLNQIETEVKAASMSQPTERRFTLRRGLHGSSSVQPNSVTMPTDVAANGLNSSVNDVIKTRDTYDPQRHVTGTLGTNSNSHPLGDEGETRTDISSAGPLSALKGGVEFSGNLSSSHSHASPQGLAADKSSKRVSSPQTSAKDISHSSLAAEKPKDPARDIGIENDLGEHRWASRQGHPISVQGAPYSEYIKQVQGVRDTLKTAAATPRRTVTASATSTALARRSSTDGLDDLSSDIVSAVGQAEATGVNPYVAVARATARAASLASANATAGVAALPGLATSSTRPAEVSVVISTSCRVNADDSQRLHRESKELIESLGHQVQYRVHRPDSDVKAIEGPNNMPVTFGETKILNPEDEGPRIMTIVIQLPGNEAQKVTCDVPVHSNSEEDISSAVSAAVKRILTNVVVGEGVQGAQLNRAVDRVTRQVLQAYSSDVSDVDEDSQSPQDMSKSSNLGPRRLNASDVPSRLSQNNWREKENSSELPGSNDRRVFYVKGTNTGYLSGTNSEDVLLQVGADKDWQPNIETVVVSESSDNNQNESRGRGTPGISSSRGFLQREIPTRGRPGGYTSAASGGGLRSQSTPTSAAAASAASAASASAAGRPQALAMQDAHHSGHLSQSIAGDGMTHRDTGQATQQLPASVAERPASGSAVRQRHGYVQGAVKRFSSPNEEFKYEQWGDSGSSTGTHGLNTVGSSSQNDRGINSSSKQNDGLSTQQQKPIKGILKQKDVNANTHTEAVGLGRIKHSEPTKSRPLSAPGAVRRTPPSPTTPKPRVPTKPPGLSQGSGGQRSGGQQGADIQQGEVPGGYKPLTSPDNGGEKKPYDSVLLTPVENKKTPFYITKQLEDPLKDDILNITGKACKVLDAKQTYYSAHGYTLPVMASHKFDTYDAEFEKRKQKWANKPPPSPTYGTGTPTKSGASMVLVDIDIDRRGSPAKSKTSSDDVKRRLSAARPRAPPPNPQIESAWHEGVIKAARSHDRALNVTPISRKGSTSSVSATSDCDNNIRKAKSLNTLPSSFFKDRSSYTSLLETDLDTLEHTKTPLVSETDLDDVLGSKAKSMSNLNSPAKWMGRHYVQDDKHHSMDMLNSGYPQTRRRLDSDQSNDSREYDLSPDRCASETELRIVASLNKLSLPDWYRSSIRKSRESLSILQQNNRARKGSWSEKSEQQNDSRPESRTLPSTLTHRPVVIRHRVSTFVRAAPPKDSEMPPDSNFELPSTKLRDASPVKLKRMEIKPIEALPAAMSRNDPGRESARDQYIRLRARSRSSSLTRSSSPKKEQKAPSEQAQQSNGDTSKFTESGRGPPPKVNKKDMMSQISQECQKIETYISQTFIQLDEDDESQKRMSAPQMDAPPIPGPQANGVTVEGSLNKPLIERPRSARYSKEIPTRSANHSSYLDSDIDNLPMIDSDSVTDLNIESTYTNGSASLKDKNKIYDKMIADFETQSREIEQRAELISSEEMLRHPHTKHDSNNQTYTATRSQPHSHDIQRVPKLGTGAIKQQRAALPRPPPKPVQSKEPQPDQPGQSRSQGSVDYQSHTLEDVIDGLLSLPPSVDNDENFNRKSRDRQVKPVAQSGSPKTRAFKLLRHAAATQDRSSLPRDPMDDDLHIASQDNMKGEINENTVTVVCRNPKCRRKSLLNEARRTYKTCHNCFTYYCSRDCRKAHWDRHKRKCLFSRINSACKHVIRKVHDDLEILENLTKLAKSGYLSKGRGCVLMVFPSPEKAMDFLRRGLKVLAIPPAFVNVQDVQRERDVMGDHVDELIAFCKSYNPEVKFVLEVAIVAGEEYVTPSQPHPRRQGPAIMKCAKLRLITSHVQTPKSRNDPETLILTAVPGSEFTENMEERKARELSFANIQQKLQQRGITLRQEFPDVYTRLCSYVTNKTPFAPITIYPFDRQTGRKFMCLIMPNSEPEVEWMYEPDLLEELGLSTSV